jgi:acyl-CoA synthetase (AMP-forming)/AMP-acid ligase II
MLSTIMNPTNGHSNGSPTPYGRRLIVNIVDERARTSPDREWISVPRSSSPSDGWKPITYAEAANAINRVAHKIKETLPADAFSDQNDFPTIAYIGPNDARYLVMTLGAIKAGCQALFISPRNSMEGQLNLFEKTHCDVIAFDATYKQTVQPWLEERESMRAIMASSLEDWFPKEKVSEFPYSKTFEQAEWDPLCVLHTSGSTGLPKPIVVRQGMLAIADKFNELPEWQGTRIWIKEMAVRARKFLCPSEYQPIPPLRPCAWQLC